MEAVYRILNFREYTAVPVGPCFLLFSQQQQDTWYPCCRSAAVNNTFPGSLALWHSPPCSIVKCVFCSWLYSVVFLDTQFSWTIYVCEWIVFCFCNRIMWYFFCFFANWCLFLRNVTQNVVDVLCDKVLKWMELITLKNCICRLSALCRLCGRRSNQSFDDRKIILCKTLCHRTFRFSWNWYFIWHSIQTFRNIM